MCDVAGIAFAVLLLGFMIVWIWASYPIWNDPFFRDSEAFREFTSRVTARKAPLLLMGGAMLALAFVLATGEC